jgi:hypothetical protein
MNEKRDEFIIHDKDIDWNMSLLFLTRLDQRLSDRDVAYNQGDIVTCYRCLRTVYSIIIWFIRQEGNEEEEKKLETLFERARISFRNMKTRSSELSLISQIEFEELLDDISFQLNYLIIQEGLVFPKKIKKDLNRAISDF